MANEFMDRRVAVLWQELMENSARVYQGASCGPLRPLSMRQRLMLASTEDRVQVAHGVHCVASGKILAHGG